MKKSLKYILVAASICLTLVACGDAFNIKDRINSQDQLETQGVVNHEQVVLLPEDTVVVPALENPETPILSQPIENVQAEAPVRPSPSRRGGQQ